MSDEKREILVITGKAVKYTGIISFKFMIDADPDGKLHPMPQKWGFVWKPKSSEDSYSFNVFEGNKGMIVGGGWTSQDTFEWAQEMLDALPSCTLLMDDDPGYLHLPICSNIVK